jgi:hypothetical protein
VKRIVLIYGLLGGLLVAVLKLVEYRFLVVEHSLEIYGGIVALIFSALGIWLGLKLTRTQRIAARAARHHAARAGDSRGDGRGAEQPRNRRTAVRQRKHGEDSRGPRIRQALGPAADAGDPARERGRAYPLKG